MLADVRYMSASCQLIGDRPADLQGGIGFGEMRAAEESARGGKRRRVRGFQHGVAVGVDPFRLALGIAAPQQEDHPVVAGC